MPDKAKPIPDPAEPQEVTVVNPPSLPVKVEITNQAGQAIGADPQATAAEIVAKADVAARALEASAKVAAADKLEANVTERQNRKFDFYQVVLVALIAAAPGVITAWRIGAVSNQVEATHKLVNSTATELREEVRRSSRAEGVLEGSKRDDRKEPK